MKRLSVLAVIVGLCLTAACAPRSTSAGLSPANGLSPLRDSAQRAPALHVLDRLGFGPRPGDVDRVLSTGIDRYVDRQLDPGRIPDTVALRRVQVYDVIA